MATPDDKPDTTCPACDLTNENLEGLPCTASAEMERFLATVGQTTPEPRGLLSEQPVIVVTTPAASLEFSLATARESMRAMGLLPPAPLAND